MFELDDRLEADTVEIGELSLCRVLLMNDAQYPWVILVPQRENVREIFELSDADQHQLMIESNTVAKVMADHFKAEKMNVAALGNMVPQLHIHHIVRFGNDAAWPKPVWGLHPPMAYGEAELAERLSVLKRVLCA